MNPAKRPLARPEAADSINRHLGSRLKQLRANRQWSLEALASASGVSRSMITRLRSVCRQTCRRDSRVGYAFAA